MNDPTTPRPDLGDAPYARAIDRLFDELDELRSQVAEGVRTRAVVIVDDHGTERTRLTADGLNTESVRVVDADGTECAHLTADGLVTEAIRVVDPADGAERVRITPAEVRAERVTVAEVDGFPRIRLSADGDHGHVLVRARTRGTHSTQVDIFALDAEDHLDRPYTGIELMDQGNSTAGFALYEGRTPRLWTAPTP